MNESSNSESQENELPRWVQVLAGLVIGALTLLCGYASLVLLLDANEKNPILAAVVGFVLLLGCLWVLEKCLRLLTGRKVGGGLMTPGALRVVSFFFLFFPVAGFFTGYYRRMGAIAVEQAVMYFFAFLGLRALARKRENDRALDERTKQDCDAQEIAPKSR
jgi:membrane associated rhomboid family serine protease